MFKIAIAEDHNVLRTALVNLINDHSNYEVIVDAPNGKELITRITEHNVPDLVLIDVEMPIMDGPTTVQKLRSKYGEKIKLLGLSVHREIRLVREMLDNGANGYVSKAASSEELFIAMEKVLALEFYISSDISKFLKSESKPELIDQQLSETEEAILLLICNEKTNQEIAESLDISRNTVNTYRTRMLEKLGVKNSIGLVIYAIKKGIHRI